MVIRKLLEERNNPAREVRSTHDAVSVAEMLPTKRWQLIGA